MQVQSDRHFRFAAEPTAVWDAIGSVDDYRRWWPWLVEFDGQGLEVGDVWACAVRPPLPHTLRFTIALVEVVRPRLVTAQLDGDLQGSARLEITAGESGSELQLVSSLGPSGLAMRMLSTAARPIARYGHDWILDTGATQFATRALKEQQPPTPGRNR